MEGAEELDYKSKTPEESRAIRTWTATSLNRLADELGTRKLGHSDIQNDARCPSLRQLEIEYGSVKKAIRAVGLYPLRPEAEDLIRSLKEFHKMHGFTPRMADANEGALPYSASCYVSCFGSWNEALEAAGLETIAPTGGKACRAIQSSERDAAMLQYLHDLYGKSGVLPTQKRHDQSNPEYTTRQYRHLGKWSGIAEMLQLRLESARTPQLKTAPPQTNEKVAV